jgi:hypothetical protein
MSDKKFRGQLSNAPSADNAKLGYDALMHEVCVGWGYCGCMKDGQPLHVDLFIPAEGPVTADQFVEWVFLADNTNPNLMPDTHRKALRQAFLRHMGGETVDAKLLKWGDSSERGH